MNDQWNSDSGLHGGSEPHHTPTRLILVPGIDGTALLFYRQRPLLERHFDVHTFPLPTADPQQMSMTSLVADLALHIGEVSDDDGVILVGESFGGALALLTAIDHPDLVRGLVIINSFPYLHQRVRLTIAPRLLKLIPWGAMPLVRRYTSAHLHSPHTHRDDIEQFRERARAIDRRSYIRRMELLRRFDVRHKLHLIGAPTLFVAGDRDRLVPSVSWARYMHERVGRSAIEILNGYGHVCLIDHDLDISEVIVPWWDEYSECDQA